MSADFRLQREGELARLRPDAEGLYAWDRWQQQALAAGLEPGLARTGRAVIREAVQHDWPPVLQAECGWADEGRAMLERALRVPHGTARRWSELLDTDGGRGRWDDRTGAWVPIGEEPVPQGPVATVEWDTEAEMLALMDAFPTLRGVLAVWSADDLDEWASESASSGGREAARFVLEVWNPSEEWRCGRFDWHHALSIWDEHHRAAFIGWLKDPFYP